MLKNLELGSVLKDFSFKISAKIVSGLTSVKV
jgi:hypothetical protein